MGVKEDVFAVAEPIVEAMGYHLVETECQKEGPRYVVRVFVYRPEGVSLEDCQRVSVALGPVLDERNLPSVPYHLEVSSPGAERVLRSDRELSLFQGRPVKATTREAIGHEYVFYGRLGPVTDSSVQLFDAEGRPFTLSRSNLKQIRLVLASEVENAGPRAPRPGDSPVEKSISSK